MLNKLFLDLNNFKSSLGQVERGDSVELKIKLLNNQDYLNSKFRLLGTKADNKVVEQINGITLGENLTLTAILEPQFVNCEGIVKIELNVVSENTEATTKEFYFFVSNTMNYEVVDSSDSVKTLEKVSKYVDEAKSNLESLNQATGDLTVINTEFKENEIKRKANELIREKSEKTRLISENTRAITEEEREANELERIKSENDRKVAESNRKLAENNRKTSEKAREEAEINRQNIFEENENLRNINENSRIEEEKKRATANNKYKLDETSRQEAETLRLESEKLRVCAETKRVGEEKKRADAEIVRQSTYTNFNLAEEERKTNETVRQESETLRAGAEKLRESAELARETEFTLSQEERNTIFNQKENERSTAFEVAQTNRSNTFEENEIVRDAAFKRSEQIREDAEVLRIENEKTRVNSEITRETSELERIEAEKLRVAAEEERKQTLTNVESDVKRIDGLLKEHIDNHPTGGSGEELVEARRGFFGKEHLSLKERLDEEFNFQNKGQKGDFIEQVESHSHSIQNTIAGATKDMIIKGRTLLNLNSKTPATIGGGVQIEKLLNTSLFKVGSKYTVNIPNRNNKNLMVLVRNNSGQGKNISLVDTNTFVVDADYPNVIRMTLHNTSGWDINNDIENANNAVVLEGENILVDSYFESVKSFGELEEKIIEVSKGKNLFDNSFFDISNYDNSTYRLYRKKFDKYNTKYTISVRKKTENVGNVKVWVTFGGTPLISGSNLVANGTTTKISSSEGYIDFSFYSENISKDQQALDFIRENFEIQIEEGYQSTQYEPYQQDKKEIILPFEGGLKSLPNNINDFIKGNVFKNIEKVILNGNESIDNWLVTDENPNLSYFIIDNARINPDTFNKEALCNNFKVGDTASKITQEEGIALRSTDGKDRIYLSILTSKIPNGLQEYFKINPLILYYKLKETIEYPLDTDINLDTYDGATHLNFENSIKGTSSFKSPINTTQMLARLDTENRALKEENIQLKDEMEKTSLSLADSDLELIKQNVDLDFRVMEIEFALDVPINLSNQNIKFINKKGEIKGMARTPYEMMKIVILSGDYDKEDYMKKAKTYFDRGRMTKEEYEELISLMTADEISQAK